MNICIKPISEENFIDVFNLKLSKEQEAFVSHPIRSLAQAYVYRTQCQPFGIYADEKVVGYVMAIYDYDIPEYDIWHMMIDEPFGDSDRVALTCNKDNTVALELYKSMGFELTGNSDEDEVELALYL